MLKSYTYESGTTNLNFLKENSYSLIDLSDCPQAIFCDNNLHGLDTEVLILPKDTKVLNPYKLSHSIIQKIIFPEKIRHLAEGCLSDVYGLKEVDFTNTNLNRIGAKAFSNCQDLEKVILSQNVNISQYAFKSCIKLQKINIENASSIGHCVFKNCRELTEVTINGYLSDCVFEGCTKLKNIYFLKNADTIYEDSFSTIFEDCENLKNIYIDKKIAEKVKETIENEFGRNKNINICDNFLDILIENNKSFKEINKKMQSLER